MNLIRLGDLTINKNLSTITIGSEELCLEPKLLELLLLFCDNQQQIVTRQQILETVWPDSIVTDNAVNKLVASLRKVLRDEPKNPKYIQTVPKRGYRLKVDVETLSQRPKQEDVPVKPHSRENKDQQSLASNSQSNNSENSTSLYKRNLPVVATLAVIMIVAYFTILWRPGPVEAISSSAVPAKISVQELTRMQGLERSPLMSPDQSFILYLREDQKSGHRSLWLKDQTNEQTSQILGLTPYVSRLIALDKKGDNWQLFYLAQENGQCQVSVAELIGTSSLSENLTLFNCEGMRIHDVTYSPSNGKLYYSASSDYESGSKIYQLDIATLTHNLITQPEVSGMGNRGIDLAPDGNKLLIVQLDKDFNSRLHVLNLQNNQLETGLFTQHNIEKATWAHDSIHVMYFDAFPSRQIVKSDIQGDNRQSMLTVSEYVETEFSRIENSHDIIFSTINMDFNNRWISHVEGVKELSNSTVYDMQPTLAHTSLNYAFVSTRTGQEQIYYGDLVTGSSRVISRLNEYLWLKKLSFSPDDEFLLTVDMSHIWIINIKELLTNNKLIDVSPETSAITTQGSLLTAIWLNNDYLYYKTEEKGQIKGYIFDRNIQHSVEVDNRWQTILTDHKFADTLYMIDPVDTQIYQMPMAQLKFDRSKDLIKFPESSLSSTGTKLPKSYFDLKLHDGRVYYVTASNMGNALPYDFQIEVKPIQPVSDAKLEIYKTSCSCGFDIADSGFVVSELMEIKGDVYRTLH